MLSYLFRTRNSVSQSLKCIIFINKPLHMPGDNLYLIDVITPRATISLPISCLWACGAEIPVSGPGEWRSRRCKAELHDPGQTWPQLKLRWFQYLEIQPHRARGFKTLAASRSILSGQGWDPGKLSDPKTTSAFVISGTGTTTHVSSLLVSFFYANIPL